MATKADLLLHTLGAIEERQQTQHKEVMDRFDKFEQDYGKRLRSVEREQAVARAAGLTGLGLFGWLATNWQTVKAWFHS